MKKLLLIIATAVFANEAAANPKTIGGCQVTKAENGNYYFRADPDCLLFGISPKTGNIDREKEKDEPEAGESDPGNRNA